MLRVCRKISKKKKNAKKKARTTDLCDVQHYNAWQVWESNRKIAKKKMWVLSALNLIR